MSRRSRARSVPRRTTIRAAIAGVGALVAALLVAADPAAAAAPVSVMQIDRQDVAPQPGSEPDTLVEPDIAVSPVNSDVAIAAAHDGRFPDGGAVDISYAWTHDGGHTWHHAPLPGLTVADGGVWDRASDPVLAFGADGTAYLSALVFDNGCATGVTVSRSTDGGQTFGAPVLAHRSNDCNYSDDKNFLVVDTHPTSPFFGRLYQFWTPFVSNTAGDVTGSRQVLRWSDDQGRTWSHTVNLTPNGRFTQNSQPMVQPNGTLIDTYLDYGPFSRGEGAEAQGVGDSADAATNAVTGPSADAFVADRVAARRSTDGGATWSVDYTVTRSAGEGPADIRCCLDSAAADPVTGELYVAWTSPDSTAVQLSQSPDGHHWSTPAQVSPPATGQQYINVDVTAYGGTVYVAESKRLTAGGHTVQQEIVSSTDGVHFNAPLSVGPLSDLRYAAVADGLIFPGDYMGTSATAGRLYMVWCRSAKPPTGTGRYHQTVYGAVLGT